MMMLGEFTSCRLTQVAVDQILDHLVDALLANPGEVVRCDQILRQSAE
jgi:hypothetical protein